MGTDICNIGGEGYNGRLEGREPHISEDLKEDPNSSSVIAIFLVCLRYSNTDDVVKCIC